MSKTKENLYTTYNYKQEVSIDTKQKNINVKEKLSTGFLRTEASQKHRLYLRSMQNLCSGPTGVAAFTSIRMDRKHLEYTMFINLQIIYSGSRKLESEVQRVAGQPLATVWL